MLTPIPVGGPFDRVGVDVLQLPKSSNGNRYAIVFMDYLTKWPEVFPSPDQTAPTIAKLLVEEIISCHGVPRELLSDRGPSFLSKLLGEICLLMGIKKVNTTAYHPQTDGLVERFNRTLLDMLAKKVKPGGQDWDSRLPFILFAYRTTIQQSTLESPFFLLYGRDPQLPVEATLCPPVVRNPVCIDDYKTVMMQNLSAAWKLAQENVHKAQSKQKRQHDKKARGATINSGDRVFVYMPAIRTGPAYKLTRPYEGPYRVITTQPNGVELRSIDNPKDPTIQVALNRVRHCPDMIIDREETVVSPTIAEGDTSPAIDEGDTKKPEDARDSSSEVCSNELANEEQDAHTQLETVWTNRLRPRNPRTAPT